MKIYLMRHGTANSSYVDPEQGLSADGREGVQQTADFILRERIAFDLIVSSPKLRAAQTADIVAKSLEYRVEEIVRTDTLKPNSSPVDAMRFLARYTACRSILCVGHLPSLPRLAAALISAATIPSFPNANLYRVNADAIPPTEADFTQLFAPEE